MASAINARLLSAAELVRQGAVFADIGTDHAYLPIFLLERGRICHAVCADINEGPLNSARANAAEAGLIEKVELVLTDGAAALSGKGITDYAICGMGGELIAQILEHRKEGMEHFVLQPQRSYDVLRQYLAEKGFEIKKEAVSCEGDKMYCAFYAIYTGKSYAIGEKEALLGKKELHGDENLYCEYVEYRRKEIEKALKSMEKAGAEGERYIQLKNLLEIFKL